MRVSRHMLRSLQRHGAVPSSRNAALTGWVGVAVASLVVAWSVLVLGCAPSQVVLRERGAERRASPDLAGAEEGTQHSDMSSGETSSGITYVDDNARVDVLRNEISRHTGRGIASPLTGLTALGVVTNGDLLIIVYAGPGTNVYSVRDCGQWRSPARVPQSDLLKWYPDIEPVLSRFWLGQQDGRLGGDVGSGHDNRGPVRASPRE